MAAIPTPEGPPIARRPLHAEAVDRLRDLIVSGALAPEVRLNERVLAARLGISRTPLREAFKLLAAEGLVDLLPNRGAIVAPLEPQRIADTFAVMGALESLAGELACSAASSEQIADIRALHYEMLAMHARGDLVGYFRYNQAIHMKLVEASGNEVLANAYRHLNANVRRARYMANLTQKRWDEAVNEHEKILQALIARDAEHLKRLLGTHLSAKLTAVLGALAQQSPAAAA